MSEQDTGAASFDVDDVPDGLVVVNSYGALTLINRAAGHLLGVDPAAVVGAPLESLPGFDALTVASLTAHLPLAQAPVGSTTDATVELPTGQRLAVRAGGMDGRHQTVLSMRQVDPSVDSAGKTAVVDPVERGDLIAIVAHELRSPVTSVRGFTATLLEKWERFSDEQRRLMLETVAADADRLTRLIAELLDVARIDAGRLELRTELTDVAELLRLQIERHHTIEYYAQRLRLELVHPLPRQWVDRGKFERIITNLVENALQHGSGVVRVALSVGKSVGGSVGGSVGAPARGSAQPSVLSLLIDDEGPGVPAADRGRVFDKFWRANQRSGTGLGLFIVRGLVGAHGGTVRVESAPSGGARFRVEIPLRAAWFDADDG